MQGKEEMIKNQKMIQYYFRYLDHVLKERDQERAGGYTNIYPCLRALQDAFNMLYHVKETVTPVIKAEKIDRIEPMES